MMLLHFNTEYLIDIYIFFLNEEKLKLTIFFFLNI